MDTVEIDTLAPGISISVSKCIRFFVTIILTSSHRLIFQVEMTEYIPRALFPNRAVSKRGLGLDTILYHPRRHGPDFHPRGTQFIWDSGVSVFPQLKANQKLCFCFCFNSQSGDS